MLVTLIVTALLARYLDLDSFGKLSNAITFFSIFSAISVLGLDTIVIRELVRHQDKKDTILGSVFYLRFFSSGIIYAASILFVHWLKPGPDQFISRLLVIIISASVFFQSFDVFDLFFQSQVKSKYSVLARITPFLIINASRILLIYFKAPLIYFAWAVLGEWILNASGLFLIYLSQNNYRFRLIWDRVVATELFMQSFALFISTVAAYTYTKVDQLMIAKMLGDERAGLFSASARIFDLCFFIIVILTPSIFPSMVNVFDKDKRLFYKRYIQVSSFYTLLGYGVLVFVIVFGDMIIHLLYGPKFTESAVVLKIQIFGMLFMFNGGLRGSYLMIKGCQRLIMQTSIITAVLNIIMNYFLIPRYGITGSAFATALTNFFAFYFINIFSSQSREIFFLQSRAFILRGFRKNELFSFKKSNDD